MKQKTSFQGQKAIPEIRLFFKLIDSLRTIVTNIQIYSLEFDNKQNHQNISQKIFS
jgi:hypothetical protein